MITPQQITDLLTIAAYYDRRKTGETDVRAWLAIAQLERWDPAAAQRVILEHYRRGADRPRIEPPAVSDRIRELRNQAAVSFEAPRIPDDLADADYPAWYRARLAEHVDRLLTQWAATGTELPRSAPPPAITVRSMPELIAKAPAVLRKGMSAASRRIGRVPRAAAGEPERRAVARAEIAAANAQAS